MANSYPTLWFTSGTPMRVGRHDCAYERWLGYHAGPHGTGYRTRRTAVPLATGAAVHRGLELLGGWILEWQAAHDQQRLLSVPDEVIAWAAIEAAAGYESTARAKGLELTNRDVSTAAAIETLILEQRTLIEAQVWLYAIVRLPYMLSIARVVDVEREEGPVLDCTCGLGDWVGDWQTHEKRGCAGIVAMGRTDWLWEQVADGVLLYEEFKTKATPNYGWEQQWEHSQQLFLNMEAASRRIGKDVSQAYVPVLYKGRRDRVDRDDKSQPKIQQSPLVYGWFDPGNGMNRPAEWSARYRWMDDWGKWHTLGRTFTRRPIWDENVGPLNSQNPNGVPFRTDASRVQRWVKGWILPIQYGELLKTLGPFPKPRTLLPAYEQALLTEERSWRDRVLYLRNQAIYTPADRNRRIDTDTIGRDAGDVFARSWQCTRFDGTPCPFVPVCHKHPGWESMSTMVDAVGEPIYEIRTPHHATEKEVYEALGVTFPVTEGEEDGGEE